MQNTAYSARFQEMYQNTYGNVNGRIRLIILFLSLLKIGLRVRAFCFNVILKCSKNCRCLSQLMDTFYELLTLILNRPVICISNSMIFCLGVTLLFDFKLLQTKSLNSLEFECMVKLKHCI